MKQKVSLLLKICALFVLLSLVLAGCIPLPNPTQPSKGKFTVEFMVNGELYRQQRVEDGSCPGAVSANLQGITVLGWVDARGNLVKPETVPVTGDTVYKLFYYPQISRHVPYLFTDENDRLRPDDKLTEQELSQALEAIAASGAKAYFPELPKGTGSVDGEFLRKTLLHFFPDDTLREVITVTGEVSRSQFAAIMNILLSRDLTETLILEEGALVPLDITDDRQDIADLLEAALPHTEAAEGITWEQVDVPTTLEPGFFNKDGYLYYITEEGYYLKDGKVGDLYFGADGRYTCGDKELDDIVAQLLKKMIEENPQKKDLDLLRVVHEYCRDSFQYLRRYDNAKEVGQTGWAAADAKEMFQTGRGNCYNFAAAFWALSRGLGYETYAISGTCTGSRQPHGWCLINIGGEDYFFDCEWEYAYRNQHNPPRYDMDMFMIPMDKVSYWTYRWTTY